MAELTDAEFGLILKRMAKAAAAPEAFFNPFFKGKAMPKDWFLKYTWTEDEEEEFKAWMVKLLMKRLSLCRGLALGYADMFLFDYGWKLDQRSKVECFAEGHYKKRSLR